MITGAASGIGRATAERLASTGHRLVLFDCDENALSETREALAEGTEAIAIAGDVSDEADVGEMVHETKAHFGRLDDVVANAGINGVWAPSGARRSASIIADGVRTFTNPGATAYSATKAAQVAMAQQLALELRKHRIRVNVICPGAVETNIAASSRIRNRAEAEVRVIWPQGSIPLTDGSLAKQPMLPRSSDFCSARRHRM